MANEKSTKPAATEKAAEATTEPVLNGVTYDGTEKKQGEKVVVEAFGVVIETQY